MQNGPNNQSITEIPFFNPDKPKAESLKNHRAWNEVVTLSPEEELRFGARLGFLQYQAQIHRNVDPGNAMLVMRNPEQAPNNLMRHGFSRLIAPNFIPNLCAMLKNKQDTIQNSGPDEEIVQFIADNIPPTVFVAFKEHYEEHKKVCKKTEESKAIANNEMLSEEELSRRAEERAKNEFYNLIMFQLVNSQIMKEQSLSAGEKLQMSKLFELAHAGKKDKTEKQPKPAPFRDKVIQNLASVKVDLSPIDQDPAVIKKVKKTIKLAENKSLWQRFKDAWQEKFVDKWVKPLLSVFQRGSNKERTDLLRSTTPANNESQSKIGLVMELPTAPKERTDLTGDVAALYQETIKQRAQENVEFLFDAKALVNKLSGEFDPHTMQAEIKKFFATYVDDINIDNMKELQSQANNLNLSDNEAVGKFIKQLNGARESVALMLMQDIKLAAHKETIMGLSPTKDSPSTKIKVMMSGSVSGSTFELPPHGGTVTFSLDSTQRKSANPYAKELQFIEKRLQEIENHAEFKGTERTVLQDQFKQEKGALEQVKQALKKPLNAENAQGLIAQILEKNSQVQRESAGAQRTLDSTSELMLKELQDKIQVSSEKVEKPEARTSSRMANK